MTVDSGNLYFLADHTANADLGRSSSAEKTCRSVLRKAVWFLLQAAWHAQPVKRPAVGDRRLSRSADSGRHAVGPEEETDPRRGRPVPDRGSGLPHPPSGPATSASVREQAAPLAHTWTSSQEVWHFQGKPRYLPYRIRLVKGSLRTLRLLFYSSIWRWNRFQCTNLISISNIKGQIFNEMYVLFAIIIRL